MLPPLTVAGCAAALAAGSLFAGDTTGLRVITVATALTACVGATLARGWDRSAGHRVAELTTLRERDEWRTDERLAELEMDLEESREIRGRLEKKLRAKRSELARLRTEHADLLRRYATAESERARALEARRRLQIEGTAAQQPLALAAGPSRVGPAAFLKAGQALRHLSRNAATQQAERLVAAARRREAAAIDEPPGRHAAADGSGTGGQAGPQAPAVSPAGLPIREHRLIPAVAAAVLPYAQPQRSGPGNHPHRTVGGFDFFGMQKAAAAPEGSAGPAAGEEPASQHPPHGIADEAEPTADIPRPRPRKRPAAKSAPAAKSPRSRPAAADTEHAEHAEHTQASEPASEVIDLTAHDETEQIDMSGLRRAKA